MAAATIAVFFLLLTLSSTIHARESQFFAKVSNTPKDTLPLNNNPQNTNQQQADPTFVPQAQDSGFGLYGHQSGQLPPSDTTTITTSRLPANLPENYNPVAYTTPIHSSTQDIPKEYNYEPKAYTGETKMYSPQDQEEFMETNNGEHMYNSHQDQEAGTNGVGNMYNYEKQGMSDTRFMDNGKYYYAPENAYDSKNNLDDTRFMETENGGNMYTVPKQRENEMYDPQNDQGMGEAKYGATNNDGNMYNNINPGKQGMSDTRFLENGKYYYDVNSERLNNANANINSRGVRNGFETQGYYGDNQNPQGYYDNSQNKYDKYNTNGGYQNQVFNP